MDKKKIYSLAIGAGVIIASALGGAIGYSLQPQQPICDVCEPTVCEPVVCEPTVITDTVTEYVNQTVEKEVLVDNGNLAKVLDYVYDSDGSIEYLTDGLDVDEVDAIVDRIIFINSAKKLSVDYIKSKLFSELDREEVVLNDNSTEKLDEDDMERLRINDDLNEISISDVDFDDSDATIEVTGRFKQDDVKYDFTAQVAIEDGKVEDFVSISVSER